jgi:hypothetical protein
MVQFEWVYFLVVYFSYSAGRAIAKKASNITKENKENSIGCRRQPCYILLILVIYDNF